MKKNCLTETFLQLCGTTGNTGEKLDGHISDEDYLTCKKIWNVFGMHEKYG